MCVFRCANVISRNLVTPNGLDIADFDGDGLVDIVVTSLSAFVDQDIVWYANQGTYFSRVCEVINHPPHPVGR